MIGDQAAQGHAKQGAQGYAHRVKSQGLGALVFGHIVGDQGLGRRTGAGFSHPDADAVQAQLGEALGRAAQHGEAAPGHQGGGDDPGPIAVFRLARDGDAQHAVEDGEGEARHHADLPVGQMQVVLDRLGQDGDHLAVEEIDHIDGQQQDQSPAHIAR